MKPQPGMSTSQNVSEFGDAKGNLTDPRPPRRTGKRPDPSLFTRAWAADRERAQDTPRPYRVYVRDRENTPEILDIDRAFGPNDAANQALHEAMVRYGNYGWWVLGSKPLDPDLPLPGDGDELWERGKAGDR